MPSTLRLEQASIEEARTKGLDDLLHLHWEEVEIEHERSPLAINWKAYRDMERSGVLKPFLLLKDGRLIGYTVWFLQAPIHHSLTRWAVCDLLYVLPEHRGRAGLFLVRQSELKLRELGAKVINYNVKPVHLEDRKASGRVGRLLAKLGYRLVEEAWAKYF